LRAKPEPPVPDRSIAYIYSTLIKQVFYVPQREWKPYIQHNCKLDDVWTCFEIAKRYRIGHNGIWQVPHRHQVRWVILTGPKGFFATDLMCTHEEEFLEYCMVIDCVIECPFHRGRFDICTGKARSAPVHEDLRIYPVKVEGDRIYVQIDD
tara:strand:+ start:243 stop:695 length:453 start_codon:yes stop_codon:yes gene_type:complete